MNTRCSPEKFLDKLLKRTICNVKVMALIVDKRGKVQWGWNNAGCDGNGEHAEACAIRRANKKRLVGADIYIKGVRAKNNRPVLSKPCVRCLALLKAFGVKRAIHNTFSGEWQYIYL